MCRREKRALSIWEHCLTQKPSKSDGRRQGGKVDEDDGREDLRVQSVSVVTEVVTVSAL